MSTILIPRICRRCGAALVRGLTLCSCGKWNIGPAETKKSETVLLSEVNATDHDRIVTGGPWDRAFGLNVLTGLHGIVTTSVTLLGGARGAGKSTISLQIAAAIARVTAREVLYLGTEESPTEIALRGKRLGLETLHLIRAMKSASNIAESDILDTLPKSTNPPAAIILDSYFGMTGDHRDTILALSVKLKNLAVLLQSPVIAIEHITKQENFAGPESLQHNVDTVMALTLNSETGERILYPEKNRFGVTTGNEVSLEMTERGLILRKCQKCGEMAQAEKKYCASHMPKKKKKSA